MAFCIFPSWFIDGSLTRGVRSNVSSPRVAHTNRLLNCSTNDTWKYSEKKEKEIKKQLDVPSMNYIGQFSSRISMCRRLIVDLGLMMMMIEFKFLLKYYSEAQLLPKKPKLNCFTSSSCVAQLSHYSDAMSSISRTQVGLLRNNVVNIPKKENNFKLHNILLLFFSSYSISMRSFFSFLVCLRQRVQSWQ